MLRRLAVIGIAALAVAACKGGSAKKSGPVVASGNGFTITADEFKARLDEQSPVHARPLQHAREEEGVPRQPGPLRGAGPRGREGRACRTDPDVQQTLRKVMVQKLVQKRFSDPAAPAAVPDADVQKYYDEHSAEFHRPKRMRASVIVLERRGSPESRRKRPPKKALAVLQAPPAPPASPSQGRRKEAGRSGEKKEPRPPSPRLVTELSEDAATKAAAPGTSASRRRRSSRRPTRRSWPRPSRR